MSERFIDLLMFMFKTIPAFHQLRQHRTPPTVDPKSVIRGQSTTLTCPIDITNCGDLHSIKWFKGTERIGVASGDGKFSQVEGSFSDRYNVLLNYLKPFSAPALSQPTQHFSLTHLD